MPADAQRNRSADQHSERAEHTGHRREPEADDADDPGREQPHLDRLFRRRRRRAAASSARASGRRSAAGQRAPARRRVGAGRRPRAVERCRRNSATRAPPPISATTSVRSGTTPPRHRIRPGAATRRRLLDRDEPAAAPARAAVGPQRAVSDRDRRGDATSATATTARARRHRGRPARSRRPPTTVWARTAASGSGDAGEQHERLESSERVGRRVRVHGRHASRRDRC